MSPDLWTGLAGGLLLAVFALVFVSLIFGRLVKSCFMAIELRDQRIHSLQADVSALNREVGQLRGELSHAPTPVPREKERTLTEAATLGPTSKNMAEANELLRNQALHPDDIHGRLAVALRATGALDRAGLSYCDEHDRTHRTDVRCKECA